MKLLDLQPNLTKIEERLSNLSYLGEDAPDKCLWNAYFLVFLHPSPDFEVVRFDQDNKEVLERLSYRGVNSRVKVLEDARSLINQGNAEDQNLMIQNPLSANHLDNKMTRVESTLERMNLIVSQVDTDAIT